LDEMFGIPYIDNGLRAGVERAREDELEVPDEVLYETGLKLEKVIDGEGWSDELDEGFLKSFVAGATVANIARYVNEADPLQEDDLRAYLEHTVAFYDSFSHRHGGDWRR